MMNKDEEMRLMRVRILELEAQLDEIDQNIHDTYDLNVRDIMAVYHGWADYGDELKSFSTTKSKVRGDVTPCIAYFVKRRVEVER